MTRIRAEVPLQAGHEHEKTMSRPLPTSASPMAWYRADMLVTPQPSSLR